MFGVDLNLNICFVERMINESWRVTVHMRISYDSNIFRYTKINKIWNDFVVFIIYTQNALGTLFTLTIRRWMGRAIGSACLAKKPDQWERLAKQCLYPTTESIFISFYFFVLLFVRRLTSEHTLAGYTSYSLRRQGLACFYPQQTKQCITLKSFLYKVQCAPLS